MMQFSGYKTNEFGEKIFVDSNNPDILSAHTGQKGGKSFLVAIDSKLVATPLPPEVRFLLYNENLQLFESYYKYDSESIFYNLISQNISALKDIKNTIKNQNTNAVPFYVNNFQVTQNSTKFIEELKQLAKELDRCIVLISPYPVPQLGKEKDFNLILKGESL